MLEQQGISALLLVLRQDTHQHQVDTFGLMELERTETMPPSEWPQATTATLLQGTGHGGDGDANSITGSKNGTCKSW